MSAAQGLRLLVTGTTGQVGWELLRSLAPLGEGNRPMLTLGEIRDLDRAGVEIGAHTVNHPELDVLAEMAARAEIETSKRALEDGLGKSVPSFAYPHGYSSPTTRRLVREAGFRSACRVAHAFSSPGDTLFSLSRIIMTSAITAAQV